MDPLPGSPVSRHRPASPPGGPIANRAAGPHHARVEALIRVLRAWLDGRPLGARLPPEAVEFAARHRLDGTLYHIGAKLGDHDAARCGAVWAAQLAAHLKRCETVARHWPPAVAPPLIFKGADLSENVYDDPGARQANDIDLLLPSPGFERAHAALAAAASDVRRPRAERLPWEPVHAFGYLIDGVLVELHRDPFPPHRGHLPGVAVYAAGQAASLGGLPVRAPSPAHRVLLWLGNAAKGAFDTDLAELLDLALLLRPVPPGVADRAAARAGLGRALLLARHRLAQAGLGPAVAPPPPWLARTLRRLPPATAPRRQLVRAADRYAIKMALLTPGARWAALARAATRR